MALSDEEDAPGSAPFCSDGHSQEPVFPFTVF
jgi:hypothetical protein